MLSRPYKIILLNKSKTFGIFPFYLLNLKLMIFLPKVYSLWIYHDYRRTVVFNLFCDMAQLDGNSIEKLHKAYGSLFIFKNFNGTLMWPMTHQLTITVVEYVPRKIKTFVKLNSAVACSFNRNFLL